MVSEEEIERTRARLAARRAGVAVKEIDWAAHDTRSFDEIDE